MKPLKIFLFFSLYFVLTSSAASVTLVDISADTLARWVTAGTTFDFILIDVRDTVELDTTAIIATDACRPYHLSWKQGVFIRNVGKLPKNAHIILYCRGGVRSNTAGQLLVDSGYVSVYSLTGGFNGWGTRPAMSHVWCKPVSKLPAPSMPKFSDGHNSRMAATRGMGPGRGRQGNMPSFSDFDLNQDGKITEEEFTEARNARVTKRAQEGYQLRGLGNIRSFDDIDTNHDGAISPEEFSAHQSLQQQQQRP
jgi:rhodanese-related sulfurtransferase